MLRFVHDAAYRADAWLRQHIRFYSIILGWGLVLTMIETVRKLGHAISNPAVHGLNDVLGIVFILVFQGALLINQVAQWHEYRVSRCTRLAGRPGSFPAVGEDEGTAS